MKNDVLLRIHVNITNMLEVKGHSTTARLLLFDGFCDGPLFRGTILPGGADTQKQDASGTTVLSARYILEGTDDAGEPCRIFLENTIYTPDSGTDRLTLCTDSTSLKWLETAEIHSEMEWADNDFRILVKGDRKSSPRTGETENV